MGKNAMSSSRRRLLAGLVPLAVEAVDGGRDMIAIAVHTFAQCSS